MPNKNTRAFYCNAQCPPEVYKQNRCWQCCRSDFNADSINCQTCGYKISCLTNRKGGQQK
jgi:hypothetical protein